MNGYGRGEDNQAQKKSSVVSRETFGMTLLLFSVVLLVISIIGSYILGEIGVVINAFLYGVLGFFIYPVLLLCIYASLVMISGKKIISGKWLFRVFLIVLSAFLIAHLTTSLRFYGEGFGSYLNGCWKAAETSVKGSTAGGVLLGLIVYPLRALLTTPGAYVILVILLTASVFLFLWKTPVRRLISHREHSPKETRSARKDEGEVAFEDLPPRTTAPRVAEPRPEPRYEQPKAERFDETSRPYYEAPRPQSEPRQYPYETRQPQQKTTLYERYGVRSKEDKPETPSSRDILFSPDPVRDYWGNPAYNGSDYFNGRVRKSTMQPVESAHTYPDPTETPISRAASAETGYSKYSESYGREAEQPQGQRPRNIVEQKPESEPRDSGYTLNYTQIPSYKATQVPPEPEKPRDYYENDVPGEAFSSQKNVFDTEEPFEKPVQGSELFGGLHRASADPIPEPLNSEPEAERVEPESERFERSERFEPEPERFERTERFPFEKGTKEDASGDIGAIPNLFPERDGRDSLFGGRDRDFSEHRGDAFDEPENAFTNEQAPEPEEKPEARRMGFGEPEDLGGSRAIEGLDRGSRAELFDSDGPDEFDVAPRGRAGEFAPEKPSAPQPKPKHVYRPYKRPSMSLLRQYDDRISVPQEEIERNSAIIIDTLAGFRVDAEVMNVTSGPSVTRYDIDIPRNISLNTVTKRSGEIAMRLHARDGVNMYANNETGTISIEVPNSVRATVGLASIMQAEAYLSNKPGALMFAIGKDIEGRDVCGNIAKMKHLLVAGATGSGKSVCLNTMLISLICKYSPEDLRLILIDPKKVEFTIYDGLPHLMINEIISEAQKAIMALNWSIKEMERRYGLFEQKTRSGVVVRDLDEYNKSVTEDEEKLPKIVIVVDELADLMSVAKKEIEERIQRLTQKSRAAGIHMVIATQRPSVDVITGVIKGNLPTRMAFRVIQEVDSRTILDESGAEKLLGNGDMLYKTEGMFNCARVQGAFLSSEEVQMIVNDIKQNNESYFDSEVSEYINRTEEPESSDDAQDGRGYSGNSGGDDPLYVQSLAIVVKLGSASISLIQRKCNVGYNHAGKIMEWMEEKGYVSPFDGKAKARTVLLTKEEFESKYGPLD